MRVSGIACLVLLAGAVLYCARPAPETQPPRSADTSRPDPRLSEAEDQSDEQSEDLNALGERSRIRDRDESIESMGLLAPAAFRAAVLQIHSSISQRDQSIRKRLIADEMTEEEHEDLLRQKMFLARQLACRRLLLSGEYLTVPADAPPIPRREGLQYLSMSGRGTVVGREYVKVVFPIAPSEHSDVMAAETALRDFKDYRVEVFVRDFNGQPAADRRAQFERHFAAREKIQGLTRQHELNSTNRREFTDKQLSVIRQINDLQSKTFSRAGYYLDRERFLLVLR